MFALHYSVHFQAGIVIHTIISKMQSIEVITLRNMMWQQAVFIEGLLGIFSKTISDQPKNAFLGVINKLSK